MKTIILIHLATFFLACLASAHIRSVAPSKDQITVIRTALGIATLIQTPEAVQSAIIGDQGAFRVENLESGITIKPLQSGARTNLYLTSGGARYNLRLESGAQNGADYVVYLGKSVPLQMTKWNDWSKTVSGRSYAVSVTQIGRSEGGFFLLRGTFKIANGGLIEPKYFWVTQKGQSRPLDALFLTASKVGPTEAARYSIAMSKADLLQGVPIVLEVRGQESLKLELPSMEAWK